MRRPLAHLIALALGVGAALLVACGAGAKGGIPAASAGELKSQIEDVQQAVDGGRCDELEGQLRQVDDGVQALPATVVERLRSSLRDAADRLRREAVDECDDGQATTPTTPEPVKTQTQTEPAQTTTTATTPQTATVAPETTTTPPAPPPPPPVTQPPPVEPPPAEPAPAPQPTPPATPGGGATPGNGNGNGNGDGAPP